jgi:hypothetical protein
MGKGRRLLVIAMLLATAGVMGWLLLSSGPPEPVYKGKPLSYWLEGFDVNRTIYARTRPNGQEQPTEKQAMQVVNAVGAEGIPYLLGMLEARDSKIKLAILKLFRKQHVVKMPDTWANQDSRAWLAWRALHHVGRGLSNSVPQLIVIFERDDWAFAQTASLALLAQTGPDAASALPVILRRGITHTNAIVRGDAIYALRTVHPEPKLAVPVLIKSLDDPDPWVRGHAARALADYGKDAEAAVPSLLELYRTESQGKVGLEMGSEDGPLVCPDWILWIVPSTPGQGSPYVKGLAGQAIRAIDPEAESKIKNYEQGGASTRF